MENVITLDTPIPREAGDITALTIRKPNGAALKGVSLRALLDMEADTLTRVIPRVVEPMLTPAEVAALEPADLLQVGVGIASFFVPKSAREDSPTA